MPSNFRNLVIYEIYVRSHGASGTFADVEADLPRIRALGVDVIWFMPIHPIGKENAKGSAGCPYSIADYYEVNPEYGSKDDFAALVESAHKLGLKVMIDVVYNHTSHDSVLLHEHADWYHRDESGRPVTTVPEWSDIIDLDHGTINAPKQALWDHLIGALKQWVRLGVDGFRCDVAAIIPLAFWLRARAEIAEINPETIWLAESVHPGFIAQRRRAGLTAHSDCELYQAFDITYDYDIFEIWRACASGLVPVERYMEYLLQQDSIYPDNYCKFRFVENHDQPRVMQLVNDRGQALAWTAFQCFNPGAFLVYAGQESAAKHKLSLFEQEVIDWKNYELQDFLRRLFKLKKDPAQSGQFTVICCEPVVQAVWQSNDQTGLYGIFNVRSNKGDLGVFLADGVYQDLLSDAQVEVKDGVIQAPGDAFIFRYQGKLENFVPFSPPVWHFEMA